MITTNYFHTGGWSTVNEDATKPMRELVKAFACVDQLALRKLAKLLIDSPFFQFLPMARRVPEYRQSTIVSSTCLRYGHRHIF
jgi:hypothetical protein